MPQAHATYDVVFCCEASIERGVGHVMRCLTLSRALQARGLSCAFYTSAQTLAFTKILAEASVIVVQDNPQPPECQILIIDDYERDARAHQKLRNSARAIMVIDDLANRQYECDILLDQTYGRQAQAYQGLVPDGCQLLCGAEYILLRPEFLGTVDDIAQKKNKKIENIFISFGGTNPNELIQKSLKVLAEFSEWPLHFIVATGKNAQGLAELQEKVEKITAYGLHTVALHIENFNLAPLMKQADIAIGGGGTMSWERMAAGLPSLLIELSPDQCLIAQNLAQNGAVLGLGKGEQLKAADIDKAFQSVRNNPEILNDMRQIGLKICDGLGAARVADVLDKIIKGK